MENSEQKDECLTSSDNIANAMLSAAFRPQELTDELRKEILMFVLERSDVKHFNDSIKSFSVQRLYSKFKRELKATYPELMPTDLYYAITMADVFRPYKCDEIDCPALLRKIDNVSRYLPKNKLKAISLYPAKVIEHDLLVMEYSEKLKPQNELIKLFKKVHRQKLKAAKK